jgi:Tol biopolymer transport system component/DNA-binding winged helix-turn-helix (wHTH) protein
MGDTSAAARPRATESSPPSSTHPFCAFGPFVVDRVKGLVWRDAALLPLPRKSFDVLSVLVDRAAQVVEKREIFELVWRDTAVEDNTLARHIATLRKVLGERPDEHSYIATISGHGYRFVAPVNFCEVDPRQLAVPPERNQTNSVAPGVTPEKGGSIPLESVPVQNGPRRAANWKWLLAAGMTGLLATGAATWFSNQHAGTAGAAARNAARSLRQVTFALRGAGLESDPSWSPSGDAIAYTSHAMGNADIWVQSVQGGEPRRVTASPAHDWQAQWSPDGKHLVFRSERNGGGLYVTSVDRPADRQLTSFGYQPQWSPDGKDVLFLDMALAGARRAPGVHVVPVTGGEPVLVRPDIVRDFESLHVAWFPTGRRISVWGRRTDATWQFLTAPLEGREVTVSALSPVDKTPGAADLRLAEFVWAPTAHFLYFEGESHGIKNLWRVRVDPSTLNWQDLPERLTAGPGSDQGVAVTRDGQSLAFTVRTERTMLWSLPFDPSSGEIMGPGEPAASGGETERNPALAADGTKLAYQLIQGPRSQLWQRSLLDGTEQLLLTDASMRSNPHWSHDGTQLAYVRVDPDPTSAGRALAIVVLPTGGGGERVVARVARSAFGVSDWSPDGQWLIGTCGGSRPSVCLLPVAGSSQGEGEIRKVASDPSRGLYAPRVSPDQRWVSFHALDEQTPGVTRLYVAPLRGGSWVPMTEGLSWDDKARWAQDGRTLYFVSNRSGYLNVWGRRFNPATGEPEGSVFRVTSFETPNRMLAPSISGMEIGISADRLVVPLTEASGHIWMLNSVDH